MPAKKPSADSATSEKSEPQTPAPTFEESISELQTIVSQLEGGSLSLEESMSQFERGIGLLSSCYQVLSSAEQRIEILTGISRDGVVSTAPFDATATMNESKLPQQQPTRRPTSSRPSTGQLFDE